MDDEEEKFTWHTGIKSLKKCPHNDPINVLLTPEVVASVHYLCRATGTGGEAVLKNTEFLVYLMGEKNDGVVYVNDLYVPGQEVSNGSVKVTEKVEVEGIVGALHKHPGTLRPNFSNTDDTCLNVNHDVSIVIPSDGDWDKWTGVGRRLVQIDGESYHVNTELVLTLFLPGAQVEKLRELVETKVKEKEYPVHRTAPYAGQYGGNASPYGRGGKDSRRNRRNRKNRRKRPPKSALEQELEVDVLCPDCGNPPAARGFDEWYCEKCKQYLNGVEDDENTVNDDPMNPWKGYE